ncbi:L,D-transpeptidase family protein [Parasphingorhabdus cellanae]|uniref:L,D-transpeptidase family protein n=2 Tax=Parasphingorhabdus cellanae TaxID=2806553 RepID=A0ABX7T9Y2_9SPHN|nr:L,D-transpeptidase family protein [Parasphingorhabdus cellanae]
MMRITGGILAVAGFAVLGLMTLALIRAVAAEPVSAEPLAAMERDMVPAAISAVPESIEPEPVSPVISDSPFVVKRILQIDEPFVHGYYKWDDEGVPDGEIVITVDLKAESLSVFRDGYEIGAAVIKFGDALKPTPTGVFPITQKSKDHISNIYDVPMPYMLRLTNDGIAIHAAEVKWGYGTRGCIGVPEEFARRLFEQVRLGDRVIVTNGKMLDLGEQIVAG